MDKKEEKCLRYLNQTIDDTTRQSWAGEFAATREEKEKIAGILKRKVKNEGRVIGKIARVGNAVKQGHPWRRGQ